MAMKGGSAHLGLAMWRLLRLEVRRPNSSKCTFSLRRLRVRSPDNTMQTECNTLYYRYH